MAKRDGGRERRKMQCSLLPSKPFSPCLWSESGAEADKLGSRQFHSMVNILAPTRPLPKKKRQGECVNCSQGHGITYPQGACSLATRNHSKNNIRVKQPAETHQTQEEERPARHARFLKKILHCFSIRLTFPPSLNVIFMV